MIDKLKSRVQSLLSKDSKSLKKGKAPNSNNKKSQAIRLILIVLIPYLVADEFLLEKESTPVPPTPKTIQKKADKLPQEKLEKEETTKEEKTETEVIVEDKKEEVALPPSTVESEEMPLPEDEIINVEEKPLEEISEKPEEEAPLDVGEEAVSNIGTEQEVKEVTNPQEELTQEIDSQLDQIVEELDRTKDLIQEENSPQELTYVPPPSYEVSGRGLVYNCKGKHWACVDKESYFKCTENEKFVTANAQALECKAINVYQSYKDCWDIQAYYVNTLEDTSFCNSVQK